MFRRIAVEQRRCAAGMADTQGWQFELAELAYTRIENAHKVAYAIKVSCLFMWVLYVELLGKNRYAFVWVVLYVYVQSSQTHRQKVFTSGFTFV